MMIIGVVVVVVPEVVMIIVMEFMVWLVIEMFDVVVEIVLIEDDILDMLDRYQTSVLDTMTIVTEIDRM